MTTTRPPVRTGPTRPPGQWSGASPRGTAAPSQLPDKLPHDPIDDGDIGAESGFDGRRIVKWVARIVVPSVLLAGLAIFVMHVRLQHGPISLKMFKAAIERGISAELGELKATIGDMQAVLTDDGRLEFRLKDVEISEADGDAVASAPLAAVELSRAAMWSLRAVPERVFLIRPKLGLSYSREAGLSLRFSETREEPQVQDVSKTASPGSGEPEGPQRFAPLQGQVRLPAPAGATSLRQLDFARLIAMSAARARRGEDATSYLREFGLRDATVVVDNSGEKSEWAVPEASIDLEHLKRKSVISGLARVASSRGPWVLTFRTEDSEKTQAVSVKASVRDLVPSTLAETVPDLGALKALDLPVAGDASLELTTSGVLKTASLAVELGKGDVRFPSAPEHPLPLDAGILHLDYDAENHRLMLAPSTVRWGGSRVTATGSMLGTAGVGGDIEWDWSLKARDAVLAAEEFGVAGLGIDEWGAGGRFLPGQGRFLLSAFRLKAGGSEVSLTGEAALGTSVSGVRFEGTSSPMTLATLKALWPRAAVPVAREWARRHVVKGNLASGSFKVASGRYLAAGGGPAAGEGVQAELSLDAADVRVEAPNGAPPVEIPRVLVRATGDTAEVTAPEAVLLTPSGKRVPLKGARFAATGLGAQQPQGEFTVRTQTPLQPLLEIASKQAGSGMEAAGPVIAGIDGKVDAQIVAKIPLTSTADRNDLKLTGKVKVTDLRSKQKIGPMELQGGSIDVAVSETVLDASGELLLNGVIAKLKWKHDVKFEGTALEPLEVAAVLDNSDRTQLGLDINHIVQGEVPMVLTIARDASGDAKVQVKGDLANAEIGLRDIAWKKPKGQAAAVTFDVAKGKTDTIELQNFKVTGDNVAIEGWLSIDGESEVREFFFPDFSLNVVSRLEVQGRLSPSRIWNIKAKGSTFDARDFFRGLVALSDAGGNRIRPLRPSAGIDVDADIDTLIGHTETSLRSFKLRMSERADQLTALDAQGTLDGGKPLTVSLRREASKARIITVQSPDAGQAFKLIGFYRNLDGGKAQIEVNLDAVGAADKSGNLWIENFRVLGDPVVSEVVANTPDDSPTAGPKGTRKVVREKIDFTRMFARFSTGHNQLVLEDAAVTGPIIGATIRGRIDYATQRLSLGGTYVPLQGINAAFCNIPLVGQIITGMGCEGLLGITYAIQGPIAQPQVIINPFSVVAPGIFREIFTMTNPNPTIVPRGDARAPAPGTERVGASSSPVVRGDAAKAGNPIDGWAGDASGAKN